MSEISERYRRVAAELTRRIDAVPADGWDAPTPCEGWVARDVVNHLAEWMPAFFFGVWGVPAPSLPSVNEDPAATWRALDAALQAALEDEALVGMVKESPMGSLTFDASFEMAGLPDLLIHTWDLARATGQDEHLLEDELERLVSLISDEEAAAMEGSGHYGPRVPVPDDADVQTRVLAFVGRRP